LEVASYPNVLRLPSQHVPEGLQVHRIPEHGSIVCHNEGLVEPITLALTQAALRDRSVGEYLVSEAATRNGALPLLARLLVAFKVIVSLEDEGRREWARRLLDEEILPKFQLTTLAH
jgi:hypothetical protein